MELKSFKTYLSEQEQLDEFLAAIGGALNAARLAMAAQAASISTNIATKATAAGNALAKTPIGGFVTSRGVQAGMRQAAGNILASKAANVAGGAIGALRGKGGAVPGSDTGQNIAGLPGSPQSGVNEPTSGGRVGSSRTDSQSIPPGTVRGTNVQGFMGSNTPAHIQTAYGMGINRFRVYQ